MHTIIGFLRRNPWAIATLVFLALAGGTCVALKDAKKPWVLQQENAERAARGKPPTHRSFREIWIWYGSAATAVIFLGAGATSRWWMRPAPPVRGCDPLFPIRTGAAVTVQHFGLLLSGITLLAAVPRVARMDLSFWTDEDWALCSYVWGKHVEEADGTVTFHQTPWTDTLWFCKRANNHILYSVLSRTSLAVYNSIHGNGPDRISEWAVRFPALVAGLGAIVVAALLLRRFGHPVAGLIVACFLAIHPQHIIYSSEARGYSLMILLLLLTSLVHLVRRYGWTALLFVSPVLAAVVGVIHNTAAGHAMLAPYLLPSLPPAGLCLALMLEDLGFAWFLGPDPDILRFRNLLKVCIPCLVVATVYLGVYGRSIASLITQPKENFREAVRVTRWEHEDRFARSSDTVVVGLWRSWEIYDPRLRFHVTTGNGLMETVRSVRASGMRLFVVVGHLGLSREANPDFLKVVEDQELFTPLAPIWGRDLMTTLWPYELKRLPVASEPASLEGAR